MTNVIVVSWVVVDWGAAGYVAAEVAGIAALAFILWRAYGYYIRRR